MTVTSLTTETVTASSGAGQTVFLFDFPVTNKANVFVYKDGVLENPILYTVNYTVGDQGGDVTYLVSPTTGSEIIVFRSTPLDQILQFPIGGPFPSRSHESALDKLLMTIQELTSLTAAQIVVLTNALIADGTVEKSHLRWNDSTKAWEEFLTYALPLIDGSVNEVIVTDGAGVLSFAPQVGGAGGGILHSALTSVSGVLTMDYVAQQSVYLALDEDITSMVFNNLPAGRLAQIEFEILQDSPVRTMVWPGSTTWIAGTEIDLSVVNATYLVRLRTRDAGTNWIATFGEDFK
jgi:hypothetical protein